MCSHAGSGLLEWLDPDCRCSQVPQLPEKMMRGHGLHVAGLSGCTEDEWFFTATTELVTWACASRPVHQSIHHPRFCFMAEEA